MNHLALKFMFRNTSFIIGVMEMSKANNILRQWSEGKLPAVISDLNPPSGWHAWCVNRDDLVAIHSVTMQELHQALAQQGQQPQTSRTFPRTNGSGL